MRRITFGRPKLRDVVAGNVAAIKAQNGGELPADLARSLANLPLPKVRGPNKARIGPSEHQEQVTVIDWWRHACKGYGLPEFALFAIPNGGARDPITGSRLKAEGVRPGIPDLFLAAARHNQHGLFIEMKRQDGIQSARQKDVSTDLSYLGYGSWLAYSASEAIAAIKQYLA